MMTDQDYWWNHLSYEQRVFILDWYETHLEYKDMLFTAVQKDAYENHERWHTMAGWPESVMRTIA